MISTAEKVKSFIERKLEENKLKKAHVAQGAGLSTFTVQHIVAGNHNNVSFKVVLKLADYFKCTIDEVLGRDKFKDIKISDFKSTTLESSMERVKEFINVKMSEEGLDVYKFARICGLGRTALRKFIMNGATHKSIDANNLLPISDTFNISIDELIGRTEVNPSLFKSKERADTPLTKLESSNSILKNLSAQTADEFKNIQKTLESFQSPAVNKINVNNLHKGEIKKSSKSR